MQGESYLNPGKGEDSNSKSGYGLVQWTPYKGVDYFGDWAAELCLPKDDIDTQLQRILTEVSNPGLPPVQWLKQSDYNNMTFNEFTQSNESVAYLTEVFLNSYERPSVPHLGGRLNHSEYWEGYFK